MMTRRFDPKQLDDLLDHCADSLIARYKILHAAPELSHYEEKSSALLAHYLRQFGYEVTDRVGLFDRPEWKGYGVVAVLKNGPGPTLLIRSDMDALPLEEKTGLPYASAVRTIDEGGHEVGVMHACGHDLHMTCLLGTAKALIQFKEEWNGTPVLIGQPAEETIDGSRAMLADGLYERFPKPDFAIALHATPELAAGTVGVCPGYALASSDSVDLKIRGIGGHGSKPESAKDPIVAAAEVVVALQTIVSREVSPQDPAVITIGSIHGGTKNNIIPDEVHLNLTVRAYREEVRLHLLKSIERITKHIVLAAGIPPELEPLINVSATECCPATYNDPELTKTLADAFAQILGAKNVIQARPVMGGEDFGRYGLDNNQIPVCLFWLGASDPELIAQARVSGLRLPSLHSNAFAPSAEHSIRTGVRAMTWAALSLLQK